MPRGADWSWIGKTIQAVQLGGMAIGGGMTVARWFSPKREPEYKPPPLEDTSPMEGLASESELVKYEYRHGAFYLGRIHPDHGQNSIAGIKDDRHIFLVAGNAGGKGRSIIIQNALRWKGGLVANDPKGELASITAMRRGTADKAKRTGTSVDKFIGQDVAILDPFGETEGPAKRYKIRFNPLTDIDVHSDNGQAEIKKLASACVVPEEGSSSHFSDNAETLLAGTIEAVLATEPPSTQHLVQVRKLILNSFEDLLCYLRDLPAGSEIDTPPNPNSRIPEDGLAAEAAGILADVIGTDEGSSFKTTLSRNLKWLSEKPIQRHLSQSDLSLSDLVKRGGSVYIVIPPNRIGDFRSWLRIIIQAAINAKISLGVNQRTQETLFLLDEFPLLGTFREIEKSAGFLRGYNCKMLCAIQNIGQVKQHYAKNWETFLGNAGAIIGFSLNDFETESYLSDRMGKIMAWETSYSVNTGQSLQGLSGVGASDGKTTSQAKRERPVRLPNEVHDQTARETMRAFVIPASGRPFMIERQNYDAIPASGLYDSEDAILAWERRYGHLT